MIEDLSRGLGKTPIPVVFSDFGLPSFQYINTSIVHDQAYVNQPSPVYVRDRIVRALQKIA